MWSGDGSRVVLHVDVDAFFVQVECHRNPLLDASMPIAVQQHQDVISVSYAARALGVKKHMAPNEIRRRYPEVKLVHVRTIGENNDKVSYKYYRRASKTIHTVLKGFCDRCEKSSIDEAFLEPSEAELPNCLNHKNDPWARAEQLARVIKDTLAVNLHYTCSVGIARNKVLAKLASRQAKPAGIYVIHDTHVEEMLKSTTLTKLPGCSVYSRVGEVLTQHGCVTVADIQRFTVHQLSEFVGDKHAQRLYNWSRGLDEEPVGLPSAPKSIVTQLALSPVALPMYSAPGQFTAPVYAYDTTAVERFLHILSEELVERMIEDEEEHRRRAGTVTLVYSTDEKHRTQKCCSSACPCFAVGCDFDTRVSTIQDITLETFRKIQRVYEKSKEQEITKSTSKVDGFPVDIFNKPLTRLNITLSNFQEQSLATQATLKDFFSASKISPAKRKLTETQPLLTEGLFSPNSGYDVLAEKDSSTSSHNNKQSGHAPVFAEVVNETAEHTAPVSSGHTDEQELSTKRPKPPPGKQRSVVDQNFRPAGEVTTEMAANKIVCNLCKCLIDLAMWDEHRDYHIALQVATLPPTQPAPKVQTSAHTSSNHNHSEMNSVSDIDNNSATNVHPAVAVDICSITPRMMHQNKPDNIDNWLSQQNKRPRSSHGFRFSEALKAFRDPAAIHAFFADHLRDE